MVQFAVKYWVQWVFGLISVGLAAFCRSLSKRLKVEQEKRKALEDGMVSLLRNSLIENHTLYMDKGFCPVYARENIDRMYNAYHSLGGNGIITDLMQDITNLPTK